MSAVGERPGSEPLVRSEPQALAAVAVRRKAPRRAAGVNALPSSERPSAIIHAARQRQQPARTLAQTLGMIGLAAAVLGVSGQVLAANRLFGALPSGIVRHIRGRPRLMDAAADRLIEDVLARHGSHSGSVHSIPIRGRAGKSPAIVHVISLHEAAREAFPGATGVLVVATMGARPALSARFLRQLFGLSPAEARVANAIAAQQTIKAMADDFGVSRETVRSQLKTVLAKTGTKRQLDLAVLLTGLQLPKV
jgi:DNA-binding CsgD family transcriptional regulator